MATATTNAHGEESRQKKNVIEGTGIGGGGFGFSDISGKLIICTLRREYLNT